MLLQVIENRGISKPKRKQVKLKNAQYYFLALPSVAIFVISSPNLYQLIALGF